MVKKLWLRANMGGGIKSSFMTCRHIFLEEVENLASSTEIPQENF